MKHDYGNNSLNHTKGAPKDRMSREPKGSMPTDKQGYRVPAGMKGHADGALKPNKTG